MRGIGELGADRDRFSAVMRGGRDGSGRMSSGLGERGGESWVSRNSCGRSAALEGMDTGYGGV